ncbi:hypothetical protein ACFFL1_00270 [Samsonia erythrinae]|nr:hypothetical protein [Samsonia erythrinae]
MILPPACISGPANALLNEDDAIRHRDYRTYQYGALSAQEG